MNRALRLMLLTGITSATIGATALITTVAEAAPSANAAQHANAHSAVAQQADPAPVAATSSAAPEPGSSAAADAGSNSPAQQTYTDPQPASNADFSGNGANVHGPYDSTRDGSPSMNGNGGGKAVGKPCAGCVGKADNKNPKGQMPGGSDHNKGYECDANHGIGRSNPAHTGCTTSAPVVEPSVTPTTEATTPVTPTTSEAAPSEDTTEPSSEPTLSIDATQENNPPVLSEGPTPTNVDNAPASEAAKAHAEGPLANTGAPVRNGLVAGLVTLLAGSVLMFGSRSRRAVRKH
jgi:hypothetical protein